MMSVFSEVKIQIYIKNTILLRIYCRKRDMHLEYETFCPPTFEKDGAKTESSGVRLVVRKVLVKVYEEYIS